jgi:formate dehydrogenase alpha subunit
MEYKSILTTCPYCGCGCNMFLQVIDGHLVGTLPSKTHAIARGSLCIKGWTTHNWVESPDRLRTPLIRGEDGELHPASWDEAMDLIGSKLKAIIDQHGGNAVGFLSSARCTNEENYLMQKLARGVVGTNNIDHCARLCHSSTVSGLAGTLGSGAMTNSTTDLPLADCILVTGSNTVESHPLIGSRVILAKQRGAKLIVVDPRETPLSRMADIWLVQRPGTDVAWLNALMHVIIREGLEDKEFIAQRTEGIEDLKPLLDRYKPEAVEAITGIPAADLEAAARMYGEADKAAILYAMGITQHTNGTDNVKSVANLALLTGNIGRKGTGVNPLRGQCNVQGACDMGALYNVFPGYQKVADEAVRSKFDEAWDVTCSDVTGLTVVEMMNAAHEGDLKAMVILGENPMLSDPDINHVRESLTTLDLLVCIDIFLSETAALADVVLPAASWAEREGTFTATDRRVQLIRKAIEPIGDSRPDWEIICDIAKGLGGNGFDFESPQQVMEEAASVTPQYGGVAYDRLEGDGLQWPCPDLDHPGTPILHVDKFTRGLGLFSAVEHQEPNELPDDDYPMILTTGRMMFHYHTGTQTRRTRALDQEVPTGSVELNPDDAKRLGVRDGQMVEVRSRRGKIHIQAEVTKKVKPGVVFIPFHFAECAANLLTNPALDPVAKIPEFKTCAVAVETVTGGK